MLDIHYLREHTAEAKKRLNTRKFEVSVIDHVITLDDLRRELTQKVEAIRSEKNALSKRIGSMSPDDRTKAIHAASKTPSREKDIHSALEKVEEELKPLLLSLPNFPADNVPVGKSETEKVVLKNVGTPREFGFSPRDYMDIAGGLEMIDTARAAKVSGSRFGYLTGYGADLWFALVQYTLGILRKNEFKLFFPPVLVKREVMENTGYDSYLDGQEAYTVEKDALLLIGTGEHALLPYHSGETLAGDTLPLSYAAYSSCFRREAGSYGKDTKGILRVHQFEKVEMVVISKPEDSWNQFNRLLNIQEEIVSALGLPYHLLEVCTGDLPRPSAKVIDLECWIPSEGRYRETHSASNCTDYQSRRNHIRLRTSSGTIFPHILNATAITPRSLVAIIENYQNADGSLTIPDVLRSYLGGQDRVTVTK